MLFIPCCAPLAQLTATNQDANVMIDSIENKFLRIAYITHKTCNNHIVITHFINRFPLLTAREWERWIMFDSEFPGCSTHQEHFFWKSTLEVSHIIPCTRATHTHTQLKTRTTILPVRHTNWPLLFKCPWFAASTSPQFLSNHSSTRLNHLQWLAPVLCFIWNRCLGLLSNFGYKQKSSTIRNDAYHFRMRRKTNAFSFISCVYTQKKASKASDLVYVCTLWQSHFCVLFRYRNSGLSITSF